MADKIPIKGTSKASWITNSQSSQKRSRGNKNALRSNAQQSIDCSDEESRLISVQFANQQKQDIKHLQQADPDSPAEASLSIDDLSFYELDSKTIIAPQGDTDGSNLELSIPQIFSTLQKGKLAQKTVDSPSVKSWSSNFTEKNVLSPQAILNNLNYPDYCFTFNKQIEKKDKDVKMGFRRATTSSFNSMQEAFNSNIGVNLILKQKNPMKLIQTFYYDRKKFIRVGNYYKRDLSIQEIMGRMSVGYTMRKYNYTELQTVKILLRYSYDRNAFIWRVCRPRRCFWKWSVIRAQDLRGVVLGNRSITFQRFGISGQHMRNLPWECLSIVTTGRTLDIASKDSQDLLDIWMFVTFSAWKHSLFPSCLPGTRCNLYAEQFLVHSFRQKVCYECNRLKLSINEMIIVNSNQLSMIKRQLDLGDKTPDYNLVKILQKRFTIGMKFFRVVKECISLNEWHKRNYENYKHKKPQKKEDLRNDIRIYMLEVQKLKKMSYAKDDTDSSTLYKGEQNLAFKATKAQLLAKNLLTSLSGIFSQGTINKQESIVD